jgi:hypothetical protein
MVDYWIFGLPVIASRLRAVSELCDESTLEFYEFGDLEDFVWVICYFYDDFVR